MTTQEVSAAPSPTGEEVAYPRSLVLLNNTPVDFVEPETLVHVPPYTGAEVEFKTADQLARVESNLAAINEIRGWTDGLVLGEPGPEEAGEDAAAAVTTEAADATAAAPKPARRKGSAAQ